MLKQSANSVLASLRSSTYPRGYVSGLHSLRPCWTNCLSILLSWSLFIFTPNLSTIEMRHEELTLP